MKSRRNQKQSREQYGSRDENVSHETSSSEGCNQLSESCETVLSETSEVHRHFNTLTTALQGEFKSLETKEKEVEEKSKAWKKEKEQMQSVVEDDDIIYLNIGGETMTCSRSTLCQVEGSLLASMFSGRWEDRLKKDKHGNFFFDFNPLCFKVILNYLRAKKTESPDRATKTPTPPGNEDDNFWNLANYLGLIDELQPTSAKSHKSIDNFSSNNSESRSNYWDRISRNSENQQHTQPRDRVESQRSDAYA